MAGPAFNPTGSVKFDLKNGAAHDAGGARLLLVPSAALDLLDDDALAVIGSAIGNACGTRVQSRLGGEAGVRAAQLENVATHLAGELAIAGVGAVHVERWGRALVVVVANPSLANDAFLANVLGSALSAATARDVHAAPLGRDGGAARFFMGSRAAVDRALEMRGKPHTEILGALQGGRS